MTRLPMEMMNAWRVKHTEAVKRVGAYRKAPALFTALPALLDDEVANAEKNFYFWAGM